MPLFLRTASGKWDGASDQLKLRSVDNAQRCACNRVQYRDVTPVEKFQNLPIRNANTNYRLQFHFFGQRLIITVGSSSCGPDGDSSPLS
jgi:hypothetical protein